MRVFDRIDPTNLDRRELQLWLLATVTITVLGAGMALLMYPTVFAQPVVVTGPTMRKMFFGFCGLTILLVAYLLDRHYAMRQLRRRLVEEQERNRALRQQASVDLLDTLPEFSHFQDRLPMELRRAATTEQSLSLLVVHMKAARGLTDQNEVSTAFGDAAKSMIRRLRREDSIYLLAPQVFGIVLPGASAEAAYRVADRLGEGLSDASGACERFSHEIRVINYPEHTATAWDMEKAVRDFFTQHQMKPPGLEEAPEPVAADY